MVFKIATALIVTSGIALAGLSASNTADPTFVQPSQAEVAAMSSSFDLPLLVPTALPPGFGWADESSFVAQGRQAEQRTVMYQSLKSRTVVETCIARTADVCETKPGDEVISTDEGLSITIHFWNEPTPEIRRWWRDATFTSNYTAASWLA